MADSLTSGGGGGPGPRMLALGAPGFAAIVHGPGGAELGAVAAEDALPKALRRRMSPFDLGAARCVMGLAAQGVSEDIVFASRYGNMGVTLDLLMLLCRDEILSPAKFSMSVHNAAAGAISQIVSNRAGHTAIAAGARTLAAGLTEAWSRIASGAGSVIFIYADMPLMDPYGEFDEPGPGVHLAIRLAAADAAAGDMHAVAEGRLGAEALARALAAGVKGLTWRP
ncbi:MAG: hypothetical protein GC155_02335 [Alphaproteobacteria bacterium]|nr:hypothetical protein [Alphaproteobacteria bacterium]